MQPSPNTTEEANKNFYIYYKRKGQKKEKTTRIHVGPSAISRIYLTTVQSVSLFK